MIQENRIVFWQRVDIHPHNKIITAMEGKTMDKEARRVKVRGIILFVAIIAVIGGFLFSHFLCHTQKFSDTPVLVEKEQVISSSADVKPAYNSTHVPLPSEFVEISELTGDYKYVLYSQIDNSSKVEVKAVSEQEFEEFYQQTPYIKELTEQTLNTKIDRLTEYIEDGAVSILEHLTDPDDSGIIPRTKDGVRCTVIVYNNTTLEGSALPGKFDKGNPWKTFAYEKLSLKAENIKVKKVIGSYEMAEMDSSTAVIVEADITTESNDGKYAKQAWIPAKGKTETIDFVITFGTFVQKGDPLNPVILQVQDIGLLNTTPAMAIQNLFNLVNGGYVF